MRFVARAAAIDAGVALDLTSYMLAVNQGQLAWPFGSERFTAVPRTGIVGSSPTIPRLVGYLLGMSPTFPQAVRPPILRSELFSSGLAMGQREARTAPPYWNAGLGVPAGAPYKRSDSHQDWASK